MKPRAVGANGYRYYDRQDLLRLQQILFHRALETPSKDIQAALDDPRFDLAVALRAQRERLAVQAERYAAAGMTRDRGAMAGAVPYRRPNSFSISASFSST